MTSSRYALYFTPAPGSALARFGAAVLGYDGDEASAVPRLPLTGLDADAVAAATAEPGRYGFHATIAAPFRLAPDRTETGLVSALETFAGRPPVSVGRLRPALLSRFMALVPCDRSPAIAALAEDCVRAFDPFRAPLSPTDRQRRETSGLSARQIELLDRWGYAYVLDEFRFHMTLAGPLPEADRRRWQTACDAAFAALAHAEVVLDALSLVRQDRPEARFRVVRRQPFASATGPT